MNSNNEIPYGALYSFQPEYMADIVHEKILNHQDEVERQSQPLLLRLVSFSTAPFTSAS